MGLFSWLFGQNQKKNMEKEYEEMKKSFPKPLMPTRVYSSSLRNTDKEDEDFQRRERQRMENNSNDLLNPGNITSPLNPLSPFWVGGQDDGNNNYTPSPDDHHTPPSYDSGSNYSGSDSSSSYDSGSSSYDSSSDSSSSSSDF